MLDRIELAVVILYSPESFWTQHHDDHYNKIQIRTFHNKDIDQQILHKVIFHTQSRFYFLVLWNVQCLLYSKVLTWTKH